MKWKVDHFSFPDGDRDTQHLYSLESVWHEISFIDMESIKPEAHDRLRELQEADDPVGWLKLYNESVTCPNEYYRVTDEETGEVLVNT